MQIKMLRSSLQHGGCMLRRHLSSKAGETMFCFDSTNLAPVIPPCFWSVMPNGIRVISEQTCSPLACAGLFCETGPRFEHSLNNGISKFLEFVAYKGFCNYQQETFLNYSSNISARFWVKTTREWQAFIGTCATNNVGDVINVLARIMTDLMLDDHALALAKKQYMHMFRDLDTDPKALVFDFLHEGAFQGTPLGFSTPGCSENLTQFCRETLRHYLCKQYQPYRLVVAVSSMYSHHDVVSLVQADFGCMTQTSADSVYWPCRFSGSDVRFRDDSMGFAHNIIAVEAPGYRTPDYMTFKIMQCMLGSWHASRGQGWGTWPRLALGSEISKLCISFETFYIPYRDVGLFGVYYVTPKATEQDDMVTMITSLWKHFSILTTSTEVEMAQSVLKLKFAKGVTGCVKSCMDMGIQMLYTGCRRNLEETYTELESIKASAVKKAGQQYFYDRCPAVAALGPIETFPDYVRIRGGMFWIMY